MTDAAVDCGIEALLAVDPSPEFAARVRVRIAQEPPLRAWQFPWIAGAAAAAIAIAIVGVRYTTSRPPAHATTAGPRDSADETRAAARPATAMPYGPAPVRPREHVPARPRNAPHEMSAVDRVVDPEVLVDPREAVALRALIRGTRDGGIDPAALVAAARAERASADTIAIAPIVVEPLTAAAEKGVQP